MRLVYLIPGPMARGPLGPGELARRRAVLQRAAFPGTEVEVRDVPEAPASIECRLINELGARASRQGWRVLVGCAHEGEAFLPFGPWVDALRAGAVAGDAHSMGALAPSWRRHLGRLLPEIVTEEPPSLGWTSPIT